jgi:hypothetical protein
MPKLFLIVFLSVLFLQACSDDPTKIKNKDLIKKDEFTEILIDIHLMDAITNSPGYFRKYDQNDSLDLYSNIFKKHNVTKAVFDSTVVSYTRRPDIYKEIYDEVLLKLNMRLDKLVESEKNKLNEEVPDSLILE